MLSGAKGSHSILCRLSRSVHMEAEYLATLMAPSPLHQLHNGDRTGRGGTRVATPHDAPRSGQRGVASGPAGRVSSSSCNRTPFSGAPTLMQVPRSRASRLKRDSRARLHRFGTLAESGVGAPHTPPQQSGSPACPWRVLLAGGRDDSASPVMTGAAKLCVRCDYTSGLGPPFPARLALAAFPAEDGTTARKSS